MLWKTLIFLGLALVLAWVFGPREPADTTISFDPASLPDDD